MTLSNDTRYVLGLDLETLDLVAQGANLAGEVAGFVGGYTKSVIIYNSSCSNGMDSLIEQAITARATPQARPRAILLGT
jgi:hypothetical protein